MINCSETSIGDYFNVQNMTAEFHESVFGDLLIENISKNRRILI